METGYVLPAHVCRAFQACREGEPLPRVEPLSELQRLAEEQSNEWQEMIRKLEQLEKH